MKRNRPLDSRQLQVFVSLAATGSFTRSAENLYVTQSAVSHSMKSLEKEVGCDLMRRVGKKIMLTPAGARLLAFAHTWRDQWRHLAHHSPQEVMLQSFTPILREAKENGIQWESTQLLAIEVLLDVKWNNRKFDVERDLMPAENQIDPYTLFLDRKLTYRFRLDKSTHGNAFMIGYAPDDSEQIYSKGILGNGSGQADILARFTTQFPDRLYYFCPFEDDAGGPILIKDFDDTNKPNQRSNILLTFSFGQPQRAYQILIKSVLSTAKGEVFCERPVWLGEVILPRGLNFSN